MNTQQARELLTAFAADPTKFGAELGKQLPSLLTAIRDEPQLGELLDAAPVDVEAFWQAIGQQQTLSKLDSDLARSAIDVDESDEEEVRRCVEDLLLEGAPKSERDRVEGLDGWLLFRALEAVSSLVRRAGKQKPSVPCGFTWQAAGDIVSDSGEVLVKASAITLEIARYTDLWSEGDGSGPIPGSRATDLREWVHRAVRRIPRVLRHFESSNRGRETRLDLLTVAAWSAPLAARWVVPIPPDPVPRLVPERPSAPVLVGIVDPPGREAFLLELDPRVVEENRFSLRDLSRQIGATLSAIFKTNMAMLDSLSMVKGGEDEGAAQRPRTIRADAIELNQDGFELTFGESKQQVVAKLVAKSTNSDAEIE